MPKSLILSFEPGTNALHDAMVAPMNSWTDFKGILAQLRDPEIKEKFYTIGIDTADKAWDMCERYICTQSGVSQIGELAYGKGYDLCKKEYSGALEDIARLGYGMCFISHSAEKRMKDEKGEDYITLAPALSQRPYDIINKMVDTIGYIATTNDPNNGTFEGRMYFRGDQNFLAGSRFKYIVPYTSFDYQSVETAILTAIDKEIEAKGGDKSEATNELNTFYKEEEKLDFHALMNEARGLWSEVVGDSTEQAELVLEKVKKIFGKPMKISEATPDQVELLNLLVIELRQMKEKA